MAAVTPPDRFVKSLRLVDQAIEEFPWDDVERDDILGISIHTFNAIHGYALAKEAKKRGATVIFGGPHASIFPEETLKHGDAVVTGDAEIIWSEVLEDYSAGRLKEKYRGGQVDGASFTPARWDLMKTDRYLMGTVQTVRGCPKQCSFCSVWVQDGRVPRLRTNDAILLEVRQLYRAGFRLVFFADDNFYPYSRQDIANARDAQHKRDLEAGLEQRFDLLNRLGDEVPHDMFFCTQITMEVADDPEYMAAMKRAHVKGALIGIESITQEGLNATRKTFNSTGKERARKLETIRTEGFPYIMGAFIFGISSDTEKSLQETIQFARDCGIALAQFIPMTPLPGTVDFHMIQRGKTPYKMLKADYDYWLDPDHPRVLYEHPNMTEKQLLTKVEAAWREFYGFSAVIARSRRFGLLGDWRRSLAYFVVCRGLLTRYKRYGLSADSAVKGTKKRLATLLGKVAMRLLKRPAMPPLPSDQPQPYMKSAAA